MDKKLTAPGAKAPDKKRLQKRGRASKGGLFVEVDLGDRGFDPAVLFGKDNDAIGSYVYHPEIASPTRGERDPYRVMRRGRRPQSLGRRLTRMGASAVALPIAALGGLVSLVGRRQSSRSSLRAPGMPPWLLPAGATAAVAGVSVWLMMGVTPSSEPVLDQILAQNGPEKAQQVARLAADDGFFSGTRTRIVQYTAHAGDTVSRLAARYGLSEHTIRTANGLGARDPRPGQTLAILPVNGVLHEIANGETSLELAYRYDVSLAKIKEVNANVDLDRLGVGQKLVIPGAKAVKPRPAPRVRQVPVRLASAGRTATRDRQQPVSRSLAAGGRFVRPTAGYLSSNYGWRWGSFHRGVDIAAEPGTAIRAARDGVVVSASWDGAYGQSIVISHGGGLTTRYAHCSRMHVSPGQRVAAGETIGAVGATGRATGPHVHFEVLVNGTHVNPAQYL